MRLATLATTTAAFLAAPLVAHVAAPSMSEDEFLTSVRCAAYEDVTVDDAKLGVLKLRLNAEARRQAPETVRLADLEVEIIAREAERAGAAHELSMFRAAHAQACQSMLVAGLQSDGAG